MTQTFEHWRLDAIAQTERLIGVAMREGHDTNEAYMMVHNIMWRAMTDMLAPLAPGQLDTALRRALNAHALA